MKKIIKFAIPCLIILTIFLSMTTVVPVLAVNTASNSLSSGYVGKTSDGFYYSIIDSQVSITGYAEAFVSNVVVPSEIEGYPVTNIDDEAFNDNHSLENITLPEGLKRIGKSAFEYCYSLAGITIPSSVIEIGEYAFNDCWSLSSVMVDKNNPVYDSRDNCNAIIETETNTLVVGCMNTIVPSSVTSIGDYAFWGCDNLTSLSIPNGVANIGVGAFGSCYKLSNIIIPDSVITIGDGAFIFCGSLKTIEIPKGLTTLSARLFEDSGLEYIRIPASVASLDEAVFSGCYFLESIVIDKDNPVYDSRENCNAVIETATNTLIYGCNNTVIPSSVTKIGDEAFYECYSLANITIPNGVLSIGDRAFYSCDSLEIVEFPDSVSIIGYAAFKDCDKLSSVEISSSDISIGGLAFAGCDSLEKVVISEGVTEIGYEAFSACLKLTSITIPSSVKSIGEGAFSACCSLEDVVISEGVTEIGDRAFGGCVKLTNVTIPSGVNILNDAFANCTSLENIVISEGVKEIGAGAFYNTACYNSADNWHNGVLYIGRCLIKAEETLSGDYSIKSGTTFIANAAFCDVGGLESIHIPTSITNVGSSAFYGCDNLENVYIDDLNSWLNINFTGFYSNPLRYAENLYLNNELVKDVVIPNGTIKIPHLAFFSANIESITIPESVKIIESNSFNGCNMLKDVYYSGTSTQWSNIEIDSTALMYFERANIHFEKDTATEPSTPEETMPSEPSEDKGALGDVNGDGKINVKDATLIQKAAAKIIELTDEEKLRADVNADNKNNVKDATAIQKYAAKIETGFPIGEPIVSKENN